MKRPVHDPEFLVRLARHAGTITTVDIAAEEHRCARLNARYASAEAKIRFVVRDAVRLPWSDSTFDAAATMNAMHHIAHFKQVLKEILGERGLVTRLRKGCNREVLVARGSGCRRVMLV